MPAPDGGLCLWARLPVTDARPFAAAAAAARVVVMPGGVSRAGHGPDPHLRLCFDRDPLMLDEAATRLTTAWAAFSR